MVISVTGGSYSHEVGWTLACLDGTLLSGGAPFLTVLTGIPDGTFCSVEMYDSWGDGWNGAVWEGLFQTFTMVSGSDAFYTFVKSGSYPSPPPPSPPVGANQLCAADLRRGLRRAGLRRRRDDG